MSKSQTDPKLGHPFRDKKKRSALFIVVAISIFVHILGLGAFAVIKIVETVSKKPPEFESVIAPTNDTPPPPPPPPTQRTTQRSMPRPQPMAVRNPQNMSVPTIEIKSGDLTTGLTGRGSGGGLGAIGGGTMDAIRITGFGFDQMLEGTLKGTLFDFKTDQYGEPIQSLPPDQGFLDLNLINIIAPTFRDYSKNFDVYKFLRKYNKADKNLYASYFIIPFQDASIAPRSFGVEGKMQPRLIGVHYEGTFKPRKTGTFRLVGKGDDVLLVRINGKVVLDASLKLDGFNRYSTWDKSASLQRQDQEKHMVLFGFLHGFYAETGDWFTLREGVETDIEIFIAEVPGGHFGAYLLIEEEGVPGLEIFSTRPLSEQDRQYLLRLHPDSARFMPN